MEQNVTKIFLCALQWKKTKIGNRVLRWFAQHQWNKIILQQKIFWFMPMYDLIPEYVKQAVCRFMKRQYQAEFIANWLPPAA